MATMIPDTAKQRVVFPSSAEEIFYRAASTGLGAGWRVYYSCVLSAFEPGEGIQSNEIDFVLWHPSAGFVVIEVKGGRIQIENGEFFSINRQGEKFRIQNPFNQALVWKNRFYRFLKRENMRMPVCHAVCLPNLDESELPVTAGVERELVIGRGRLANLEQTLNEIVRKSHLEKYLKFVNPREKAIDRLVNGSHYESRKYLREYIDHHDLRVADIESIQESLVTPVTSALRLGIEGEAGTGKTMLAAMLARRYRDEGARVLLTSSNPLLNERLRADTGRGVDVMTYSELASRFGVELLRVPSGYQGKLEDWIQFDGPEKLKQAIGQLDAADPRRYDVILCDEAQDVQPFWWEAIESLLADSQTGRFYLFFDRSQGVFGSGGGETLFVPEQVLPVAPPYFPLVHNYRTTKEISTFAREFRTGKQVLQSHSARSGFMPQVVTYKDREDAQKKLEALLLDLVRREHVRPGEIALVSARNPRSPESILAGMKSSSLGIDDGVAAPGGVQVATVAGFKGLEAKAAILVNFSEHKMEISNPIMSSMMYVAATRARHLLIVMLREGDSKIDAVSTALKAAAIPGSVGSLVIDRSEEVFEAEGVVTFFDPDRMGSLTIDDGERGRRSFLFFPYDLVRAGLGNIRVGMRLLFRPRQIGEVVVASDFRLPRAS
ncbi:hypothetical protein EBZ80_24110 [bacterium]|nr:hypothetical protein [bacterium]